MLCWPTVYICGSVKNQLEKCLVFTRDLQNSTFIKGLTSKTGEGRLHFAGENKIPLAFPSLTRDQVI